MAIVFCVWNLIHPFPFLRQRTCSILLSLFQEMRYGMARVFVTRCFNFSTAFTEDWLIHLWEQDLSEVLVLDEISNSQLFSSAYIFNSQTWISTRILRVCKREFRALESNIHHVTALNNACSKHGMAAARTCKHKFWSCRESNWSKQASIGSKHWSRCWQLSQCLMHNADKCHAK